MATEQDDRVNDDRAAEIMGEVLANRDFQRHLKEGVNAAVEKIVAPLFNHLGAVDWLTEMEAVRKDLNPRVIGYMLAALEEKQHSIEIKPRDQDIQHDAPNENRAIAWALKLIRDDPDLWEKIQDLQDDEGFQDSLINLVDASAKDDPEHWFWHLDEDEFAETVRGAYCDAIDDKRQSLAYDPAEHPKQRDAASEAMLKALLHVRQNCLGHPDQMVDEAIELATGKDPNELQRSRGGLSR